MERAKTTKQIVTQAKRNKSYFRFEVGITQANEITYSDVIRNSKNIHDIIKPIYSRIDYVESFYAIYLSNGNKIVGISLISTGGTVACLADERVIFAGALLCGATCMAVSHNHPSG